MEISYVAREIIFFSIVFFLIGAILYNFTIADRDTPVKKH